MGTNRRFWPDSEVSLHGGASKQFGTCSRRSKYGGLMGIAKMEQTSENARHAGRRRIASLSRKATEKNTIE
jgi:hypothetical protein